MKNFLLLFILISTTALFSQNITVLDSAKIQQLNPDEIEYINISVEDELVIEKKSTILVDMSLLDIPSSFDSMQVSLIKENFKKSFTMLEAKPFLLENIDSSVTVSIVMFNNGETLNFKSINKNQASFKVDRRDRPTFVSDTIVFGILAIVLALIFYTSSLKSARWKRFYIFVPALLLCYLIPAILDSLGLISKEYSSLYTMAKNYLLPGALILMTIGIDFKGIINLGPKAIIMFLTATVGIIIGGPLAILIYSYIDPSVVSGIGDQAAWRGFATLAGSWIGGGANQAAMLETYGYNQEFYGKMVTVDIVVANLWMAFLLWGAARAEKFDKWLKADTSSIEELKVKMSEYQD